MWCQEDGRSRKPGFLSSSGVCVPSWEREQSFARLEGRAVQLGSLNLAREQPGGLMSRYLQGPCTQDLPESCTSWGTRCLVGDAVPRGGRSASWGNLVPCGACGASWGTRCLLGDVVPRGGRGVSWGTRWRHWGHGRPGFRDIRTGDPPPSPVLSVLRLGVGLRPRKCFRAEPSVRSRGLWPGSGTWRVCVGSSETVRGAGVCCGHSGPGIRDALGGS